MPKISNVEAPKSRHLVRSHAHEEDIPGTVNLNAVEGDDTFLGQALFPVPSQDPNDPLQWEPWKKNMILVVVAAYSFLGNCALVGPSVYISIYAESFGISPAIASGLISYPNLCFGFGTLILVPMYLKFGRRPVMLGSMVVFLAGLIGASQATSFAGLMAARCFHAFGSGVCEALPVQIVNDIFFLHERGSRIGYYTVCLCLGATGPLYAGYMLAGGYSWRLFFYVVTAFAGALFVLAFLVVEESSYQRRPNPSLESVTPVSEVTSKEGAAAELETRHTEPELYQIPERKSFLSTLKPWGVFNHEAEFFMTIVRSFTNFAIPAVFWVITTYGIYIGLGALAFNYTFPIKITAPPYSWKQENSGLIALANACGFFLAVPLTFASDRLAAYLTKRNKMIREAEMRLPILLPAMLIAPAGLLVYGFTAQRNLHWIGFFFGVAMTNWGAYFYFTITLAYAVDSYNVNTSEMLIAMNLGKQAISFGMGSFLLEWILSRGYAVVIAGIFGGVLLANNLAVFVFMFWGKKIRAMTSKSKLGRWAGKPVKGQREVL